jgi:imidazolonepropionase
VTTVLIDRIGLLVTGDLDHPDRPERTNAALVIDDGRVAWVGDSGTAAPADERIDAGGRCVIPGFVDSHNHLVFAGDRAAEFDARMAGRPYAAGGIRTTVDATRDASDATLRRGTRRLVAEARSQGTTTIETKSGYGLTVVDESRSLRIAREFTSETTFLGAHVVPREYVDRRDDYVALVAGPMLEAAAPHSRWIDVFIENGAFDVDEARHILSAGVRQGLGVRVHTGQLAPSGGVALAIELGAASVDHCTFLSTADVETLAESGTVVTLVPGAEFSTRQPYSDARRLTDAGVTVALATDCNPGSSYTTSMAFCIALAVRELGMSPAEALAAATRGGAAALRRPDVGWLGVGSRGDLVILDAPSYIHLAYRPGVPLAWRVLGGTHG